MHAWGVETFLEKGGAKAAVAMYATMAWRFGVIRKEWRVWGAAGEKGG